MRRNRNLFIAAAAVAVLVVAFVAMRSSGSDGDGVRTTASKNCPPVARLDVAATTPTAPVSVDVLANDTDPDGDPLIFQIVKTTGGTSTVDDGATPTDASDDRVLFTPAVPPPASAVVEYEAIDPRGASGSSTIEIAINDLGTLPEGLRAETVGSDDTTPPGGCDASTVTTDATSTTLVDVDTATTLPFEDEDVTDTTAKSRTTTTTKKGTTKKTTTTTTKKSSGGGTTTTHPTTTTQPQGGGATSTTRPTTSTSTPGPTTSTTNPCGSNPGYGSPGWDEWVACMQGR